MMEQQSAGADRARVSQGTARDPWRTMNRLLAILIGMFILSSGTGGACFYMVFNRLHDQARDAFVTGCERDNQTRAGALKFIDSQLAPSEQYLQAIIAKSTTNAETRKNATARLAELRAIRVEENADLPQKPCDYPPLPVTAPSTTTPPGR